MEETHKEGYGPLIPLWQRCGLFFFGAGGSALGVSILAQAMIAEEKWMGPPPPQMGDGPNFGGGGLLVFMIYTGLPWIAVVFGKVMLDRGTLLEERGKFTTIRSLAIAGLCMMLIFTVSHVILAWKAGLWHST